MPPKKRQRQERENKTEVEKTVKEKEKKEKKGKKKEETKKTEANEDAEIVGSQANEPPPPPPPPSPPPPASAGKAAPARKNVQKKKTKTPPAASEEEVEEEEEEEHQQAVKEVVRETPDPYGDTDVYEAPDHESRSADVETKASQLARERVLVITEEQQDDLATFVFNTPILYDREYTGWRVTEKRLAAVAPWAKRNGKDRRHLLQITENQLSDMHFRIK